MEYPQYLIDARKAYEAARDRADAAVKAIAQAPLGSDERVVAGIAWDLADDEMRTLHAAYLAAKRRFLQEATVP